MKLFKSFCWVHNETQNFFCSFYDLRGMDFSANILEKVWILVFLFSFFAKWFDFEREREREEGQMGSSLAKETPFIPPQPGPKGPANVRIGLVGYNRGEFIEKYGPKGIRRQEPLAKKISCSRCHSLCLRGGETFNLEVWGFSYETDDSSWSAYARVCEGFVVMYNIGTPEILEKVIGSITLIQKLNSVCPILLVGWPRGNLSRRVSKEEGERLAVEHGISFLEVDAKLEEPEEQKNEQENQQPTELVGPFSEIASETKSFKQSQIFGGNVKHAQ